jgi:hypothetical protein
MVCRALSGLAATLRRVCPFARTETEMVKESNRDTFMRIDHGVKCDTKGIKTTTARVMAFNEIES